MFLTIFTATYNRAYLLPRLYDSLRQQRVTDFEWVVVDDGSTDNTVEVLSQFIKNENPFSIRFFQQKHGGKHRAVNYGIREAKGKYFMLLDSDDFLTENAVALITKWVETIENLPGMCGVAGTKIQENGELIGGFSRVKTILARDTAGMQSPRKDWKYDGLESRCKYVNICQTE